MPTFLFFKDGNEVGKVVGADPNKLKVIPRSPPPLPTNSHHHSRQPSRLTPLDSLPNVVEKVKFKSVMESIDFSPSLSR